VCASVYKCVCVHKQVLVHVCSIEYVCMCVITSRDKSCRECTVGACVQEGCRPLICPEGTLTLR